MGKIIVVNAKECNACLTCEIECSLAHSRTKTLVEAMKEVEPRLSVAAVGETAVPMQCRHCEDAPCMRVCPTHALHRKEVDGPVLLDKSLCIGCRFCLVVCPFGAIIPSYDGRTMVKCDLCIDRLEEGQEPACVASCPMGALEFVEAEAYAQGKRNDAAKRSVEQADV